jgi:hypothetical protein
MQRYELWRSLKDALDVFQIAVLGWTRDDTRVSRDKLRQAATDYVNCLHPVIGWEAAFEFDVAFQHYLIRSIGGKNSAPIWTADSVSKRLPARCAVFAKVAASLSTPCGLSKKPSSQRSTTPATVSDSGSGT